MHNKSVLYLLIIISLAVMALTAITKDTQAPIAAVSYEFGSEHLEEVKICEKLGKTAWVAYNNGETVIKCGIEEQ